MEEIKITKTDKGYSIEQGNKMSEQLCWNEMVGTIAALTMPNPNLCLQWMKEKEKPYKPKDGDFVIMSRKGDPDKIISIYEKSSKALLDSVDVRSYIALYCGHLDDYISYIVDKISLATEEEKQLLLSKLAEDGKDWDAEKKEIVEYKWKP